MIQDPAETRDTATPPAEPASPSPGSSALAGSASAPQDIDAATAALTAEEDDEARLPEIEDDSAEPADGPLAVGRAAIEQAVRLAPTSPGVYLSLIHI